MAGSIAIDCKKAFPHCAFTISAAVNETNLPLWLAHLKKEHGTTAPAHPNVDLNAAVTYS